MKLVDSVEEQGVLEEELERTKPPVPPECRRLDYLLSTPFRYGRYPGNSRFRREGHSPGVYYAGEKVETTVAETVFYRLLFFAESPATPWPANPLEFTAFEAAFATEAAIDLMSEPFVEDGRWTHPTDYGPCLDLADTARQAGIELIRYRSVRDPAGGANIALLRCEAFKGDRPIRYATWRIALSDRGAIALCDWPEARLGFAIDSFTSDPRLTGIRRGR